MSELPKGPKQGPVRRETRGGRTLLLGECSRVRKTQEKVPSCVTPWRDTNASLRAWSSLRAKVQGSPTGQDEQRGGDGLRGVCGLPRAPGDRV